MKQPRTKFGANSEGAGAHNRRVVMDALRLNGQLSRADIARGSGLAPQTVSNIIEELEREGLVTAADPIKGGRARPSVPYSLAADGAFALGMQLDQYSARIVAIDLLGQVVARREMVLQECPLEQNLPLILAGLAGVQQAIGVLRRIARPRIVGLGLAMPAPTGVHAVKDDPWFAGPRDGHPFAAALEQHTGLPVSLHHDASAASVAERLRGVAKGMDSFVYLFVGYGLGAGLHVKGELYDGAHRLAGELGQIPVGAGVVEDIASLAPLLRDLGLRPNQEGLFDRLEQALFDDRPEVSAWLAASARHLAWLVEVVACVLDPSCVVLGGQMPDRLMAGLQARLAAEIAARPMRSQTPWPQLLPGSVDAFAVAIGAAAYPIARAFDPSLAAFTKTADDGSRRVMPA